MWGLQCCSGKTRHFALANAFLEGLFHLVKQLKDFIYLLVNQENNQITNNGKIQPHYICYLVLYFQKLRANKKLSKSKQ